MTDITTVPFGGDTYQLCECRELPVLSRFGSKRYVTEHIKLEHVGTAGLDTATRLAVMSAVIREHMGVPTVDHLNNEVSSAE